MTWESISRLAELSGVSPRTIRKRCAELESRPGDKNAVLYDSRLALPLIFGRQDDPATERARLDRLRADKLEIEIKEKLGELMPPEILLDELSKVIEACRSRLLALPSKAAPHVHGCGSIPQTAEAIRVQIYDALDELSVLPIENAVSELGG